MSDVCSPIYFFFDIKNLSLCHSFINYQTNIIPLVLLHEKFLQFDLLRAVVFQLNLKYLVV